MTCMTTKQKFECDDPPVIMLCNGRYAYKVECPWRHKSGRVLYAWKFASTDAYTDYTKRHEVVETLEPEEEEERPEEQAVSPDESPPDSPNSVMEPIEVGTLKINEES